jgi:hypothetical protein
VSEQTPVRSKKKRGNKGNTVAVYLTIDDDSSSSEESDVVEDIDTCNDDISISSERDSRDSHLPW